MDGWKYRSGASYVSTDLLHSGQNKTYVSWGTLRPRALLPIVTGVQFPGLTVYGWAGTCSSDKTWGHYWQVNMVTWLLLGNIYHCVMVFSSYPHLLAQVLWVQLEPPPSLLLLSCNSQALFPAPQSGCFSFSPKKHFQQKKVNFHPLEPSSKCSCKTHGKDTLHKPSLALFREGRKKDWNSINGSAWETPISHTEPPYIRQ